MSDGRVLVAIGDCVRLTTPMLKAMMDALKAGEDHLVIDWVEREEESSFLKLTLGRNKVARESHEELTKGD